MLVWRDSADFLQDSFAILIIPGELKTNARCFALKVLQVFKGDHLITPKKHAYFSLEITKSILEITFARLRGRKVFTRYREKVNRDLSAVLPFGFSLSLLSENHLFVFVDSSSVLNGNYISPAASSYHNLVAFKVKTMAYL